MKQSRIDRRQGRIDNKRTKFSVSGHTSKRYYKNSYPSILYIVRYTIQYYCSNDIIIFSCLRFIVILLWLRGKLSGTARFFHIIIII